MGTKNIKRETDTLKVLCNVVYLNIKGVATHYADTIWVDDENDPDGGYGQSVKKLYKTPRVDMDFIGKVDIDLEVGCIYNDGINNFLAVSKNEIRNGEGYIETFKVPKELFCIYKPFRK